ncbi:hypothetical protein CYMTET_11269 [Cymbomonas tetramitiformis]|uniref:Uncharacterized protein n=1 Tax=Cymbomonas tetramitiformis TaxID=36881 RepID=A0AAE0GMG3_9CHLO|nr:hypothetical protein CYMTET_11269 [Cymbomonas tetramitiformis]
MDCKETVEELAVAQRSLRPAATQQGAHLEASANKKLAVAHCKMYGRRRSTAHSYKVQAYRLRLRPEHNKACVIIVCCHFSSNFKKAPSPEHFEDVGEIAMGEPVGDESVSGRALPDGSQAFF